MNRIGQYQKVQVMTADGVRIIIMLYEGIIKFNNFARLAIENGNIQARSTYVNRSMDIVNELQNSLDMKEGGEVAANLSRLYDFCVGQLTDANLKNDKASLDAVNRVINELKGGWEKIASERQQCEFKAAIHG